MGEHESKREFVNDVIASLVRHGAGRYDWMPDRIVFEETPSGTQLIRSGSTCYDVTCDSLTSILNVIYRLA